MSNNESSSCSCCPPPWLSFQEKGLQGFPGTNAAPLLVWLATLCLHMLRQAHLLFVDTSNFPIWGRISSIQYCQVCQRWLYFTFQRRISSIYGRAPPASDPLQKISRPCENIFSIFRIQNRGVALLLCCIIRERNV